MFWLLLGLIIGSTITFVVLRRRWILPWRGLRELIKQVGLGEQPRTFLVDGADETRRVGVALEEIFVRQRELDRQIAQRESGTQTILGAMEDGLLVVDPKRRVTLLNNGFRKLFSPAQDAVGTPVLEVLRDATVDRLLEQTLREGVVKHSELTAGDRRVQVSAVPIKHGDDGEITGAVALFHDITELKRVDQMRSDFVANVSHELRTPLSILRGYIETLLETPETSPDETHRIVGVMERHSKRLEAIVNDLLTLAQIESRAAELDVSRIDLATLLGNVVRDWERKFAEKRLKVDVDLAPNLPEIAADEARLQEIFYNLLDNAVKYTPDDGAIQLRAEKLPDGVTISISDSGIGIPKQDLPRIFERFYRADKARSRELGGTGLGLAIVKHIAQLHGGRVEAESEPATGTTIRVILPLVTQS